MFGAAKESPTENRNNTTAMIHIPLFIVCPFSPDSELKEVALE
jgi:hypothetical protein